MDPDTVAGPLVDERRWKGANLTAILGASTVAAGVLLLAAGWYGVSGEAVVAKQIPYLASATAPGTALLVAGVVLLAPLMRGADGRADATDRLLELLTEPEPTTRSAPPPGPADDGRLLAVPAGTHYHRVGCSLVLGKPDAHPVDAATIEQRGLRACPACRPDPPGGPGPTD